jgi:integrase
MPRYSQGPKLVFLAKRGVYYIRWNERGERGERSTRTTDLDKAKAALASFISTRQQWRNDGPREPSQVLVTDILADYAEEHGTKTADPSRVGFAVGALTKFFAGRTVSEINPALSSKYAAFRQRSDGTIRRELGVLRAAANWAEHNNRLTRAPFVKLPPPPRGKDRWLMRSQAALLIRAARTGRDETGLYLPHFILIALYTGARKGAILDLRWTQVDFHRRLIDLNPPGRRQTTKRRPTLPMTDKLYCLLRRLRTRGSDLGYVIHRNGNRIGDIKKSFSRAVRIAQLDGTTPHTLRHTCGTWLAQKGVDLWQIAGWLGHSVARTSELYAHHHPKYLEQARAALQRR